MSRTLIVIGITSLALLFVLRTICVAVLSPREEKAMSAFRSFLVTVPSVEVGKKIAHGLVSNKLAACVNIVPKVTSIYEWEGKINEDEELILLIKSKSHHFEAIEKFVKENHPYEVPCIVGIPIVEGHQPYLDWITGIVGVENKSKSRLFIF